MKTRKGSMSQRVLAIVIFLIAIYLGYCYLTSINIYRAVYSVLEGYPNTKLVEKYIAKDVACSLVYDYGQSVIGKKKKKVSLFLVFTISDLIANGYSLMYYTIEYSDNNVVIAGSWNIPISFVLKKEGLHWKIVEKIERP